MLCPARGLYGTLLEENLGFSVISRLGKSRSSGCPSGRRKNSFPICRKSCFVRAWVEDGETNLGMRVSDITGYHISFYGHLEMTATEEQKPRREIAIDSYKGTVILLK